MFAVVNDYSYESFENEVVVTSPEGKKYSILFDGQKYSCNCKGFLYRNCCKHIETLKNMKNFVWNKKEDSIERTPLEKAESIAFNLQDFFMKTMMFDKAQIAGSIRRRLPTIKDIDLVLLKNRNFTLINNPIFSSKELKVKESGNHWLRGVYQEMNFDVRFCDDSCFGSMLLYLTGPKEFNIWIRSKAKKMGYKLNEYGLWDAKKTFAYSKRMAQTESESDVFYALQMDYISPEDRKPRW